MNDFWVTMEREEIVHGFDGLVTRAHDLFKVLKWGSSSDEGAADTREQVASLDEADVMTSHITGTRKHSVMLDLDVPAKLVPSSTPGHSHLYIDVEMNWPTYSALLSALIDAQVIEYGYGAVSKRRRYTSLRLPWIKKETK